MIKEQHLDRFVARNMETLPDSLTDRKEHLVTLLSLLPKNYARRSGVVMALEAIRTHEQEQLKFRELLNPSQHDGHNGGGK